MKTHAILLRSRTHCGWWLALAALCVVGWTTSLPAQATNELAVVVQQDGTLSLPGSAQVPPYSMTGKWVEVPGKSFDRYVTRHFLFTIPNQSPAVELYLVHDRSAEKPDGAFEIGLARGYVSGFAGTAGFKAGDLVFEDCAIGSTKAKRGRVKLTRDQRTLWVYAYIYVREPSLTFISVRPDADAQPVLERYLGTIRLQ
jgi:hypothetical protein